MQPSKRKNSSSKYVGVSFSKREGKWRSEIRINGVSHSLGYFDKEEEARNAYISRYYKEISKYVFEYEWVMKFT